MSLFSQRAMLCLKIRLYFFFMITHNQDMELKGKFIFILFKIYDYNIECIVLLGQT